MLRLSSLISDLWVCNQHFLYMKPQWSHSKSGYISEKLGSTYQYYNSLYVEWLVLQHSPLILDFRVYTQGLCSETNLEIVWKCQRHVQIEKVWIDCLRRTLILKLQSKTPTSLYLVHAHVVASKFCEWLESIVASATWSSLLWNSFGWSHSHSESGSCTSCKSWSSQWMDSWIISSSVRIHLGTSS